MKSLKRLPVAFVALILIQLTNSSAYAQQPTLLRMIDELDLVKNAEENSRPLVSMPKEEKREPATPSPFTPKPVALSSQNPLQFGLLDHAYLDVFTILNYDNPCSRFYGGRLAITALNEFVRRLKPTYMDRRYAVRMSGPITTFQSHMTGFTFRQFDKAELNLGGAFFKGRSSSERSTKIVSDFQPNTRETRIVVLLHELGHLVKDDENKWILSDDGGDAALSVQNSQRVLSVCRKEIAAVTKLSHAEEFEMSKLDPPK